MDYFILTGTEFFLFLDKPDKDHDYEKHIMYSTNRSNYNATILVYFYWLYGFLSSATIRAEASEISG